METNQQFDDEKKSAQTFQFCVATKMRKTKLNNVSWIKRDNFYCQFQIFAFVEDWKFHIVCMCRMNCE